jgi:hypothetical protein
VSDRLLRCVLNVGSYFKDVKGCANVRSVTGGIISHDPPSAIDPAGPGGSLAPFKSSNSKDRSASPVSQLTLTLTLIIISTNRGRKYPVL